MNVGKYFELHVFLCSEKIPLTSEQLFEKEVEEKLLFEWGRDKKLDYQKFQNHVSLQNYYSSINCISFNFPCTC